MLISYHFTQWKEENKMWLNITSKGISVLWVLREVKEIVDIEGLQQQLMYIYFFWSMSLGYCLRKSILHVKFWQKDEPSKQNNKFVPFVFCNFSSAILCSCCSLLPPVLLQLPFSSSHDSWTILRGPAHVILLGRAFPGFPRLELCSLPVNSRRLSACPTLLELFISPKEATESLRPESFVIFSCVPTVPSMGLAQGGPF